MWECGECFAKQSNWRDPTAVNEIVKRVGVRGGTPVALLCKARHFIPKSVRVWGAGRLDRMKCPGGTPLYTTPEGHSASGRTVYVQRSGAKRMGAWSAFPIDRRFIRRALESPTKLVIWCKRY